MSDANTHMTIVIRLPADPAERKAIVKDFPLFGDYKGAPVTAIYAGDAISEIEQLEELVSPAAVERVRRYVKKSGSVPA